MQTKDRERVNKKTGKVTVVRDSTPIKKGVVVVKEDTAMKQLQRFCDVCKVRWGITPLQIFIYRDEGHYEMPDDETSWKPNYHTHIVWDRMNHNTGKSCKLLPQDMSEMQTIWAEALGMERGTANTNACIPFRPIAKDRLTGSAPPCYPLRPRTDPSGIGQLSHGARHRPCHRPDLLPRGALHDRRQRVFRRRFPQRRRRVGAPLRTVQRRLLAQTYYDT